MDDIGKIHLPCCRNINGHYWIHAGTAPATSRLARCIWLECHFCGIYKVIHSEAPHGIRTGASK